MYFFFFFSQKTAWAELSLMTFWTVFIMSFDFKRKENNIFKFSAFFVSYILIEKYDICDFIRFLPATSKNVQSPELLYFSFNMLQM